MRSGGSRRASANFVLIAIFLGSARPALPQDAQTWADENAKSVDAEVAAYLRQHPVRPSPLFDAVSTMLETLGRTHMMTIDECEYDPLWRDWEEVIPHLRENTSVALHESFTKGKEKYVANTPANGLQVGRSFCAELKRQYAKILRDLQAAGPALVKQGY